MKILKHLLTFFALMFMITGTSFALTRAEKTCIQKTEINIVSDQVMKTLSKKDRLKFVYCVVDETNGNVSAENEKELIEDGDHSDINLASSEELQLLLKKKSVLEKEDKNLWYSERQSIVEFQAGLNCTGKIKPGEENNIVTCIKDPRKQAFLKYQEDDSMLGGISRWFDGVWTSVINSILFAFSEFVSNSAFGYSKFDELPDIPYDNIGSMFDVTTLYGIVNTFALSILAFIVLYYFLKTGTGIGGGRGEDDYKIFLLKGAFILLIVIFFPFLYNGLQTILTSFETSLIDSTSSLTSLDQTNVVEGIRMDVFDLGALTSLTLWTLLFFIPNILLLLAISLMVYLRDIFLIILLNVFFLSAVGFLGGTLQKENIFEGNSVSAKLSKFSVYAMFWIISLFITVVVTIFIFKFITVISATIPSIETKGVSLVGNLSSFSIDAFVYLLLLLFIIGLGKTKLLKMIFNGVSNFLTNIFFPGSKGIAGYKDMVTSVKDGYADVKMERDNLVKNNKIFKSVSQTVVPLIDKTSELVSKNEFIQKTSGVLNEKQQKLREKLKPLKNTAKMVTNVASLGYIQDRKDVGKVAKAGMSAILGVGETKLTHKGQIEVKRSDLDRELKRREKEVSSLDTSSIKGKKRSEMLEGRITDIKTEFKTLKKQEIITTGTKREKTEIKYQEEKEIIDNSIKKNDKELNEKEKRINEYKEDLAKLDIEKDTKLIKEIEEKKQFLEEETKIIEREKIVQKNMKSLKEDQEQQEIEEIENRSLGNIIIPDILKRGKKTEKKEKSNEAEELIEESNVELVEDIKQEENIEEGQIKNKPEVNNIDIENIKNKQREKVSKNILDKIASGRKKYEFKKDSEDFIKKSKDYQLNFNEEIFGGNPIFKVLYNKEVKRAGGEDYIDLDYLNEDIQETIELLKKSSKE